MPSPPPRPFLLSFGLLIATILAGLAIRFAPLGLPPFLVKYGGSALYALMLYWVISTLVPSSRFLNAALLTGALATAIEFFKLVHAPGLDAFRLTLPGVLLLGRFFSVWDIAAYGLAITTGAILDRHFFAARPSRKITSSPKLSSRQ